MTPTPTSYLAFDLGASSSRAVLGRLEGRHMHMEEVCRFKTPLIEDGDCLQWDLEAVERELLSGLKQAQRAAPALRSLSVDSWAVDYVPLGAEGEPLRPPYCYRDARTEGRMQEAFARVPKEAIFAATGIQFLPINTLYQVLADQALEPELLRRTKSRLTIADYFNYRLGGRPVMDRSMASTTQLYDVRRQAWATELMEALSIDPDAWPEIVPSATRLGPARFENPRPATRAPRPEVIAGCSHDTACAVAATPAEEGLNWAYVSCGTWSLLGVERTAPLLSSEAREAGFTNEVGLNGTIRFLKNLSGLWPLQECMRAWRRADSVSYDELAGEAAAAPPHLARVDLQDERFLKRGDMQRRLQDYCHETGQPVPRTRGEVTRIILEGVADSYRHTLDALRSLTGRPVDVLHLVGGGAKNELLCQMAADACGCTVVAGPAEATALGNLLIQAQAMGDLPEDASIRAVVRESTDLRVYAPQKVSV